MRGREFAAAAVFAVVLCSTPASSDPVAASYYGGGRGEHLATHTANGEVFDYRGFTAASWRFRFGTRLRVCFHRCAVVRINDRGPALWTGRTLDLSKGAADYIGLTYSGHAVVDVVLAN